MAVIQNERDKILQAASPRVDPVPIPIDRIDGLKPWMDGTDNSINGLQTDVAHVMNSSKRLSIRASTLTVAGNSPALVTLTAVRDNNLVGAVTWSLYAGSAVLVPSGDDCNIASASISSASITVQAAITSGGITYRAYATISRLGILAGQSMVDLSFQTIGQLAMANVTGYGALALLNAVNLNTQTTGALNGLTQVNNLGTLAFANAIAADQVAAGQFAAGVVYAGNIYGDQITGGTITGAQIITQEVNGLGNSNYVRTSATRRPLSIVMDGINKVYTDNFAVSSSKSDATLNILGSGIKTALKLTNSQFGLYAESGAILLGPAPSIAGSEDGIVTLTQDNGLCFRVNGTWYKATATEL